MSLILMRKCFLAMLILLLMLDILMLILMLLNLNTHYADADLCIRSMPLCCRSHDRKSLIIKNLCVLQYKHIKLTPPFIHRKWAPQMFCLNRYMRKIWKHALFSELRVIGAFCRCTLAANESINIWAGVWENGSYDRTS